MNRNKDKWRERPKTDKDGTAEIVHDTLVALHNGQIDEIYDDFEEEKLKWANEKLELVEKYNDAVEKYNDAVDKLLEAKQLGDNNE